MITATGGLGGDFTTDLCSSSTVPDLSNLPQPWEVIFAGGCLTMSMCEGAAALGSRGSRARQRCEELAKANKPTTKNCAFVFIKPHAVTDRANELRR